MPDRRNRKDPLTTGKGASRHETEGSPAEAAPPGGSDPVLEAIGSLRAELRTVKVDIVNMIDSKIDQLSTAFRGEIAAFKDETNTTITAVKTAMEVQANTIADLEQNAIRATDTIAMLEQDVAYLKKTVEKLASECEDLSGRSRRQNLRVLFVKEMAEMNKKPRDFIAQLLKNALSLGELPLVDRCHRALRPRPAEGAPPRPFILRLHYAHQHEEILRKAADMKQITFQGKKILIFPDLPPSVVKRRALFKPARDLMRDKPGVRFGMQFPAKLRVSFNGKEHFFTDPDKATEFAKQNFQSAPETTDPTTEHPNTNPFL